MTRKSWFKNSSAGQTIVEVLIATGVVVTVLTTIAGALTYSVKNTSESKYKAAATSMAQEGVELYRRERDKLGWAAFQASVPSGTYCINSIPASSSAFIALPGGECENTVGMAGTEFTREALTTSNASNVRVEVVVSWTDGTTERNVTVVQDFRDRED